MKYAVYERTLSISMCLPPSSTFRNQFLIINQNYIYFLFPSNSEIERRNNETFTLNIVQQPEGKTLQLMFPGRQTVLDVKTGVHNITNIPVRYQDWTGWPPGVIHSTTLAVSTFVRIIETSN